jgi:predicted RNA-binding Zn-ribbon protein involved in translation (DUF1610 family)
MVNESRKQNELHVAVPPTQSRTMGGTTRAETQPCPQCGHPMPALKGGSASICPNCGFKDSCCY